MSRNKDYARGNLLIICIIKIIINLLALIYQDKNVKYKNFKYSSTK